MCLNLPNNAVVFCCFEAGDSTSNQIELRVQIDITISDCHWHIYMQYYYNNS